MENKSLLQSFALDKDGRIRGVEEVARGLACDCSCPSCGERVIARQGEIREWHFAHASGVDCEGSAESALHRAAKQVLLESTGMTIPPTSVRETFTLPDGRSGTGQAHRAEAWIDFEAVEAEKEMGNVRPDIIVTTGNEQLLVEIAVTHFVDPAKSKTLESLAIPAIEVDLAVMDRNTWNWDSLKAVLIESADHKAWLRPLGLRELEQEAVFAAMAAASALPLPTVSQPTEKPARTRFRVGGRIIDVTEFPFGLRTWSPYDPEVNELIKSLARTLGGRWQPKFKSWLFPVESKSYLFDELKKRSHRPPEVLG